MGILTTEQGDGEATPTGSGAASPTEQLPADSAPAERPPDAPPATDDGASAMESTVEGSATRDGTVTADTQADVSEPETPPAKRRTLCGVCQAAPSKYKCPRCPLAYCSVACSRVHRDNHPPAETDNKDDPNNAKPAAQEHAKPMPATPAARPAPPPHPFHILDDAPELRRLFAKYPNLPARLLAIYDATQPPKGGDHGGGGAGGAGGAGRGQRGRGGGGRGGRGGRGGGRWGNAPPTNKPWTRETGLREGRKALRRARVDPGEDGDAVREYCETVTYLLGQDKAAETAAVAGTGTETQDNAVALVREELAVEDAQVIERLLDVEGRR